MPGEHEEIRTSIPHKNSSRTLNRKFKGKKKNERAGEPVHWLATLLLLIFD